MEKKYTFYTFKGGGFIDSANYSANIDSVTVNESELTEDQIQLLLGELIKKHDKSPAKVQDKFKDWLKKKYNY